MSGLELNYRYIVSGFFESAKKDTDTYKKGDIVPLEKSFDTRRSQIIVAQELDGEHKANGNQEIWTTNINGVLYNTKYIAHQNLVHTLNKNWRISLPPSE